VDLLHERDDNLYILFQLRSYLGQIAAARHIGRNLDAAFGVEIQAGTVDAGLGNLGIVFQFGLTIDHPLSHSARLAYDIVLSMDGHDVIVIRQTAGEP